MLKSMAGGFDFFPDGSCFITRRKKYCFFLGRGHKDLHPAFNVIHSADTKIFSKQSINLYMLVILVIARFRPWLIFFSLAQEEVTNHELCRRLDHHINL